MTREAQRVRLFPSLQQVFGGLLLTLPSEIVTTKPRGIARHI